LISNKAPTQDHSDARFTAPHRDPFDRMIAAQALAMDVPVLSKDPKLDVFGVRRLW
jgi:PIN domain nuclease of toxin-antitoxin system